MKNVFFLMLLMSLAASTPAQAFWPFSSTKKEEPKMTIYQATKKLYEITQDQKLTAEAYQKEFARLVALGASVQYSPYDISSEAPSLVDHAIYYDNQEAAEFLIAKGYKPSDVMLASILNRAGMSSAPSWMKSETYEYLFIKKVKAYMSYQVQPSETHKKWIAEEQAIAAQKCAKFMDEEEKKKFCDKAANLTLLLNVLNSAQASVAQSAIDSTK